MIFILFSTRFSFFFQQDFHPFFNEIFSSFFQHGFSLIFSKVFPPFCSFQSAVSRCDSSSAASTARCVTSTQRLSSSSKLVAPSLTHAIGCRRDAVSRWFQSCTRRTSPPALLKTYVLLKARSNPSLSAWSSRAAMSEMFALFTSPADGIVSILWRTLAVDARSRHQDHARGDCREGQGKQVPCVRLFTLLGVLRSHVVARVLLLFWEDAVCPCGRARLSRGCYFRESAPCLALQAAAPGFLESPSPRSLFTHACLVSCAAGPSALLVLFLITPASSTPAPFPRALFATLVTSRRRVPERRRREALAQGSCSSSAPEVLLPLSGRGLSRDQSSRRSVSRFFLSTIIFIQEVLFFHFFNTLFFNVFLYQFFQ